MKINQVSRLKSRYESLLKSLDTNVKKLSSTCENAQKRESQICKQAYLILKSKERNLDNYDVITADVDRVEDMKKLLQVMFFKITSYFSLPENRLFNTIFKF